ncbi:MAG: flagellar export chaperone FliS [Syntrophomonas sp.]|nr:flagellar export chaperone FliS [Syntrophomonas sp.]
MNMNAQAFNQYKRSTVETVSPEKLLIMLYDGAIKNIRNAKNAIEAKDINLAHMKILKTEEIIVELMSTLNMDYEISKGLFNLYEYFYHQLVQANMKKDVELLEQVESFLLELRDTWQEAMEKIKTTAPVSADKPDMVRNTPVHPVSNTPPPAGVRQSINIKG